MSDDVTAGLIRALVEHMEDAPEDWTSLAMVLGFDATKVDSVYGFAYDAEGGDTAVTASPYDIRPAVTAYTDSSYEEGDPLPVSLLVQFDRTTGQYEVTFEDTDTDRWAVTPATFSSIRRELRPDFGDARG